MTEQPGKFTKISMNCTFDKVTYMICKLWLIYFFKGYNSIYLKFNKQNNVIYSVMEVYRHIHSEKYLLLGEEGGQRKRMELKQYLLQL